jgi:hypothetical protein
VINTLKEFLLPGGRFHISVPNGQSIHRKVGTYMGILDKPKSFTEGDFNVGHRHVFDYWSMRSLLVNNCNMDIVDFKGVLMKFLSNSQMNLLFEKNHQLPDALNQLGQELPHLCAEIYFCATNN